ncbi:lipopolysaccharide transport periplasmic protein LptA [Kushneria phosphatilytica]|uniref:Lipopolysaccharide export system protein LptA n=1 Tax=Kushneria phosphatilytica TaxID=657387 RepID=A0A1S1NXF3_9GAMM|nr:lipopolysaccharide transport periplasmic protein LptA [Kushneria phosphatilytica]OHV12252.1 lipopolysaccharide transport periplasmic protein LptA [Kushneria phosphatilytica]QEL11454.1 lipopolysaccharide transport periplasmic protein LptA [Kushneria phosphatilytica]
MKRRLLLCSAALTAGLIAAAPVAALEGDAEKPIQVSADRLQLDDKAGTAVYTGNVQMEQGSMELDAATVTIRRGNNGGVSQVTAKGGGGKRAYIEQKPNPTDPLVRGWGDTLIYHADSRRVEMIGDAELHQGDDTFNGGYVQYHLDTRQVDARGRQNADQSEGSSGKNGRVHMTLTPNTASSNDGGSSGQ